MDARIDDPHRERPLLAAGKPLGEATAAMIMLHGRGANAADIIGLAGALKRPEIAYLAPDAAGGVWYPNPFMTPAAGNQPYLSSALSAVARVIDGVGGAGIPAERVAILGFSQGGCLALEFAARNPRRYGGVIALSAGLIGDAVAAENYSGSLDGTPVFIGCSDVDPFIPLARVKESAATMLALGASVTERIYPSAGHTIVADEVAQIQRIVDAMTASGG
jgi:phospholipase/carboxylesterase